MLRWAEWQGQSQILGLLCTQNWRQSRTLKGTVFTASVTCDIMAPVAIQSIYNKEAEKVT
jgi:hypothetical protein